MDVHVAVVGAGVIGLSCARALLDSGFRVTVIGDAWTPNTTSDGAGAFWERRTDAHAELARATMRFYSQLLKEGGATAEECGVGFIDGVNWSHDLIQYKAFSEDVPALRDATSVELRAVNEKVGETFASGVRWRSVIVDSPVYLRWLMRDIKSRGGRFVARRLASLQELRPHFPFVVNASGMAARELAGDAQCHAYRGQVIRVYAPHVREFMTASASGPGGTWHSTYVLPRPTSGVVTCGGTYQRDNESVGIDAGDRDRIWRRCCELVPGLRDPRTVRIDEWCGLRPGRDGDVRIELEEVRPADQASSSKEERPLYVVHAYGHGGCGHSLSWGTALRAVGLVKEACVRASSGAAGALGGTSASAAAAAAFDGPEPVLQESIHILFPRAMNAAKLGGQGGDCL